MGHTVELIGAPTDYGTNRRGVDMGPSAIRYAGIASHLTDVGLRCVDAGDLVVPGLGANSFDNQGGERRTMGLGGTADVCAHLADRVADALTDARTPLVLGGDHSIAIGSLRGSSRDADIGTIWFDAHGDLNTPSTSPTGNVHGMSLAAALGHGEFSEAEWAISPRLREENVAIVGLRDLDDGERAVLTESDVTAFTMADIDADGVTEITERALDVATKGVEGIHVSVDLDWLDPNVAPGVGTPVRGGVTYREAHSALERVASRDEENGILRSLDIVEVNPILDHHNETAELATELAASVFGKRIL